MKVPVSWLSAYVDFDDTVEGLADKLTFAGIEVEAVEHVGLKAEGAVVGDILFVQPHPRADRLSLCTVFDGKDDCQVVCGAPNVMTGMKGAFAPVGSRLADGTRIKKTKIRGMESHGMLCAEDELGLSDDHEGILEIDPGWKPGTLLSEVIGPPEPVLELEITPNRPDCLSLIGIAREVAALYDTALRIPAITYDEHPPAADTYGRVTVEDPDGWPRYTARVLTDLQVQPAPEWMQRRLQHAGIRPINNLVDITNYVLLESGHPLHAFDHRLLAEGRIVVRRAKRGERLTTLDETTHELDEDVLVIADAERAVAVAGIMGGTGTEIREETQVVLLESAYFDPQLIRRTSRRLGLRSESSHRFERGTDIENVDWASRRAAALMAELAGGRVAAGLLEAYPAPRESRTISCRWARVRRLLGVEPTNDTIRSTFERLALHVTREDEEGCRIEIPSFRLDLEREVDLIEEFARIYGLDRIPSPAPKAQLVPGLRDTHSRATIWCRNNLIGLGLSEVVSYSLVSPALLDLFELSDRERRIVLPHPVSQDHSVLRTSLIPQIVECLGRNYARQIPHMGCFEMGRVYRKEAGCAPHEEERLAVGLMGPLGRPPMDRRRPVALEESFAWLKGIWERLAQAQHLANWRLELFEHPAFEPAYAVHIVSADRTLGRLGLMARSLARNWRLQDPVGVLEVELAPLLSHFLDTPRAQPLAAFPAVSRDVALVVERKVTHEQIVAIVKEHAPEELESVELFDVFTGPGVLAGKKSMAYSCTYRSHTRTLTDEDANTYHEGIKDALRKALRADIRES